MKYITIESITNRDHCMNDEQRPSDTLSTYLIVGFITPILPSFTCFCIIAAASFSSNTMPRVLLATTFMALAGGLTGWFAYRHQHSLRATVLTALLAPWIGFFVSLLINEGIEQLLAHRGWITIYDSYGYRIPVQPIGIAPIFFVTTLSIAIILSVGIGNGMLAVGRWIHFFWRSHWT